MHAQVEPQISYLISFIVILLALLSLTTDYVINYTIIIYNNNYGARGKLLIWIEFSLADNNFWTDHTVTHTVDFGVTQGAILAPKLFLL